MPNRHALRGGKPFTKAWTNVDSSTGQDISVGWEVWEWFFCVYNTGTSVLADNFVVTADTGAPEDNAATVSINPWAFGVALGADQTLFNIKASGGTNIDIYLVCIGPGW